MQAASFYATRVSIAILILTLQLTTASENIQAQTLVPAVPFNEPVVSPTPDLSFIQPVSAVQEIQPTVQEIQPIVQEIQLAVQEVQPAIAMPVTNAPEQKYSECIIPKYSETIVPTQAPITIHSNHGIHNSGCQCRSCRDFSMRTYQQPTFKQRKQACYWGYPEYFCEPALGAALATAFQAHKTLGDAEQFILYRCDFFPEGSPLASQLNAYGKRRLERLLCRSMLAGYPLRIERNFDNTELDELRRQQVLEYTSAVHSGLTPDMVVLVGEVRGISGIEAILHYQNQLSQVMSGASGGTLGDTAESFVPSPTTNSPNNGQ